jgi:hypothetical protein
LKNTLKISRNKIRALKNCREWLAIVSLIVISAQANATHIRSADVLVERVCGTLSYDITIIAYLNSQSSTMFGTGSRIFFGDGTSVVIPQTPSTPRPDLGTNVSVAMFKIRHTYQTVGNFQITYVERDRSSGVLNIANSHDVAYVSTVSLSVDNEHGCNSLPLLQVTPLDRACSGKVFFHTPAAADAEGDSLSYELTIPAAADLNGNLLPIQYDDPNDPRFYIDPTRGNEAGNAPATFAIDAVSGLLTWDAPGAIGEYNIAFKIIEWRKENDGTYTKLSTTVRDMQIIVEPCDNERPDLILDTDICITPGTPVNELIEGSDLDGDDVMIEVFTELLDLSDNPADFQPNPPVFQSSSSAQAFFQWTPSCADVRQQPYQVVFKITDNPPDGTKLVSFATMNIRVQAPPPVLTATLDVVKHHGVLDLGSFACENASAYQVWRKVGSFPYSVECQTGIPKNSGYQLMAETGIDTETFVDTNFGLGLVAGAKYCYRVVARIGDTKSRVSQEHCIGPVQRDAPVITHVSVEETSNEGSVRVSWRSPLDINTTQFPEPYQYHVYRADDFIGEQAIAQRGITADTTFLDTSVNPEDSIFNYRIVLYSKPVLSDEYIPVDTSAVASTVRLNAAAAENSIALHWRDSVPWSNVVSERPYHLIYRSEGPVSSDNDLVFIDSVQVVDNGFNYVDEGIDPNKLYSYKIETRGTYGNPSIALQKNFSQRVSLYPVNNLKPCVPQPTIEALDCSNFTGKFGCSPSGLENKLSWKPDESSPCRIDIDYYNVYGVAPGDTTKMFLQKTIFPVFTESNLTSVAKCYRVSAVDKSGKESEPSELICNDNCPYYNLPNVVTRNGDEFNETFSSRFADDGCPRFVKAVDLVVYNRWGKVVYRYTSSETNSIYIDWNGNGEDGTPLNSGIYFYVANVTFDVSDPLKKQQELRSWLHLVR